MPMKLEPQISLLNMALTYLGRYISNNDEVKKAPDDEWMEFHVWVHKKDIHTFGFVQPCLTFNPNKKQEDNKEEIEIHYNEEPHNFTPVRSENLGK
jgi:hypothetical protein